MADAGDKTNPDSPDLFSKAQYLIQLLVGAEISPDEYGEKLEVVRENLEEIYWIGYAKAASRDVFNRTTVRPCIPPGVIQTEIDLASEYSDDD